MRYILGIILLSLLLVACNDTQSLEKEINDLKRENAELKKQTTDSLSIYRSLKENKDQQSAEKFVDSLRRNNPKLYKKMEEEIWNSGLE